MEHRNLTLDYDKDLIDKIFDDFEMRYVILFLYIIRNDLFKNLADSSLIESYERILILDEIYKGNVTKFWRKEFTEIAIDLGLFKNIRSIKEFDQKDDDFILKLGEETITIEKNTISVPDDTLFLMINKIEYYLADKSLRETVAEAGYRQVHEGGHDIVSRMRQVLNWLNEIGEGKACD